MPTKGCNCGTCKVCEIRIRVSEKNIARSVRHAAIPPEVRAINARAKNRRVSPEVKRQRKAAARASRTAQQRNSDTKRRAERRKAAGGKQKRKTREPIDFFIDGEGHGRNPHLYTYLAAVALDGTTFEIRNPDGLTTEQILLFLTETLPNRARLWGFSLGYDKTKWLRDIPRDKIFLLHHPEYRRMPNGKGTREISWDSFRLNAQTTKLTLRKVEKGRRSCNWERRTIWDAFRYFQCSFVKALELWKVATDAELDLIRAMKEQRHQFEHLSQSEVEHYCKMECAVGIRLIKALLKAHDDIGLSTNVYFGPGSTAEKMLELNNVGAYIKEPPDWAMNAIMTAFTGGRFENRLFGIVDGPHWSYDISSAYPYQSYQLPCLACGSWSYEEGTLEELLPKIEAAALACVHVFVPKHRPSLAFAPFAFRDSKGSICYPFNCETWVWKPELLAALNTGLWNIHAFEVVLYHTECKHRPFDWVPKVYRDRLALGKDGKGIVLKLGLNSATYGKLAQSVGKCKFRSMALAGNVTSGCRAQIIEAMGRAELLEDILSIATDGIYSSRPISMPTPIDTDTAGTGKPLGGWEEKLIERGRVLVRPGLNALWPAHEKDDADQTRARGVGRKSFSKSIPDIVQAIQDGKDKYVITEIPRFVGHKSSIRASAKARKVLPLLSKAPYLRVLLRPEDFSERAECGEWTLDEHIVSFNPMPKRTQGPGNTLLVRDMGGELSRPYRWELISPENEAYREAQDVEEDQP